MRIGFATILSLRPGTTWPESVDHLLRQARFADQAGFTNIWLTEHHFTEWGATNSPGITLSHLAAATTRIRLGYSVALLPFHHPVRIAEEMLLVDQFSRGRLDIGVGRGHAPIEVAMLCPEPDRSVELFDDTFAFLRHAFDGKPFTFEGSYWKFPEVQIYPPPYYLTRPDDGTPRWKPPFYMVMTSPRSIAFAAENDAIPVMGNRSHEELVSQLTSYREAALAAGMPEERLQFNLDRVSCSRYVALADSRQEALERAIAGSSAYRYALAEVYRKPVGDPTFKREVVPVPPDPSLDLGGTSLYGTRDDIVDQLRALEKSGIRQVSINLDSPLTPPEEGQRLLERFAREVLPVVQGGRLKAEG